MTTAASSFPRAQDEEGLASIPVSKRSETLAEQSKLHAPARKLPPKPESAPMVEDKAIPEVTSIESNGPDIAQQNGVHASVIMATVKEEASGQEVAANNALGQRLKQHSCTKGGLATVSKLHTKRSEAKASVAGSAAQSRSESSRGEANRPCWMFSPSNEIDWGALDKASVRHRLAAAVEDHEVRVMRSLIPMALGMGVPVAELENPRRILNSCVEEAVVREMKVLLGRVAEQLEELQTEANACDQYASADCRAAVNVLANSEHGDVLERWSREGAEMVEATIGKVAVELAAKACQLVRLVPPGAEASSPISRFTGLPEPRPGEPGDSLRGVSVHYLTTQFMKEVHAHSFTRDDSVHEIEPKVVRGKGERIKCPRDGCMGAAYVDAINGASNAGLANRMLSYTWGYKVGDIVETLESYCKTHGHDPKKTLVWICCLCINQHRVKNNQDDIPFDAFKSAFETRVKGIGNILALMAPWRSPGYVKRVWCVFEFHTAIEIGDQCQLEIIMPPAEACDFAQELKQPSNASDSGINALWAALKDIHVEKAEASVQSDKDHILQLVREGVGYGQLDSAVLGKLGAWFTEVAVADAQAKLKVSSGTIATLLGGRGGKKADKADPSAEVIHTCMSAAMMLRLIGNLDRGMELLDSARSFLMTCKCLETEVGAELYLNSGIMKGMRNELQHAFDDFNEALRIREITNSIDTEGGAVLFANLGIAKSQRGDKEGALAAYREAYRVRTTIGTLETPDGAHLIMNLALEMAGGGDIDGALRACSEGRRIRELTGTLETPNGALLLMSSGRLKSQQGHAKDALADLGEARRIRVATGTLDTKDGAQLLHELGAERRKRNDLDGALQAFAECMRVREATGSVATPEGAKLAIDIGKVEERISKTKAASATSTEAKRCHRRREPTLV